MRVILCDRCGARIENTETTGFVTINRRDIKTSDLTASKPDFEDWDFCDDCMKQIEDFVRMKPDTAKPRVNPVLVNKFHERNDAAIAKLMEQQEEPEKTDHTADKPKATIKKPIANGTKYAPLTQEKIDYIKQLVREGKTVKEIVEETGVSDPTVRRYKREVTVNNEPLDSDE